MNRQMVAQVQKQSSTSLAGGILQRKCDECRKKDKKLQRSAVGSAPKRVPSIVHEVLRSPGAPLDPTTRAFMEPRFSHDFSTVQTHVRTPAPVPARLAVGGQHDQFEHEADTVARQINHQPAPQSEGRYDFSTVLIHTDAKAGEAARLMNAHAFTVNHHVVFDPGQYAPHTPTGRHLLAHELTHVVQQTGGNQAQPSLVAQRLTSPCIQGRWRLDRVTPDIGREQSFTNGNGTARSTASAPDTGAKVFGSARAWQEQGWVRTEVGGEAQVSRQLNMHYIFKNDGQDNHFMQLRISGDIDGTAKAEDRLHAKAYGVTWGRITERTADNPAPPDRELFRPKTAGGVSAAKLRDLGRVELEIPVGEGGSAGLTFNITTVDEGDFAGFAEPLATAHDVPTTVDEVDVFLGSHIYAEADIESSYALIASLDENYARAAAQFLLRWESRPAPESGKAGKEEGGGEAHIAGATYACAICKCQGDKECGGGRIHTIWMGRTECNRKNKAEAQRLCNHDRTFLSICDLDQNRPDGKKCSVHHHDFACSERETEDKCNRRRQ